MSNLKSRICAIERDQSPSRTLVVRTTNHKTPEENAEFIALEKERFGFRDDDELIHFHTHYETREEAFSGLTSSK